MKRIITRYILRNPFAAIGLILGGLALTIKDERIWFWMTFIVVGAGFALVALTEKAFASTNNVIQSQNKLLDLRDQIIQNQREFIDELVEDKARKFAEPKKPNERTWN